MQEDSSRNLRGLATILDITGNRVGGRLANHVRHWVMRQEVSIRNLRSLATIFDFGSIQVIGGLPANHVDRVIIINYHAFETETSSSASGSRSDSDPLRARSSALSALAARY